MKEFERMKFPVDDTHKMREFEQKAGIMEEYIISTQSRDFSKKSSDFLTKNNSHKNRESEQEKLILKELNKKLEKKTELDINQFLTMISHELRTPLTPIKAYADMLIEGKFGELEETQKQKIKAIDENARELIQFISNIVEYQKFSSRKVELQKEKVDIKKLIIDAHQFFMSELEKHGMNVNSNFSRPVSIMCETSQISQVLRNLHKVAFHSIPQKNGKIIFNVSDKKNEVEVNVWYNGQGLSEKHFKKVISEFYKVNTSNILSNGGINLSLALSKKIIEAHRGKMWFSSDTNGTKISFTLPKDDQTTHETIQIRKCKNCGKDSNKSGTGFCSKNCMSMYFED